MIQKTSLRLAALGILFFVSAILNAGVNTWTGVRPAGTVEGERNLVAAHPDDPDVVYGAFGNQLHRSTDRGRTWRLLRTFEEIYTLLVHPASPTTVLVGGSDASVQAVYQSSNAGETWSRTLLGYVTMLAGSPTDSSVIFAGSSHLLYKSIDSGATWSAQELSGVMASLVIHPRDPSTAYAGAEGIDYWGLTPGTLVKTTDGGESWQGTAPAAIEGVSAIAVDFVRPETIYVATGLEFWFDDWEQASSLLRSEDGGHSWTSAGKGLPEAAVRRLVADPRVSGTLYAGTSKGIYRTRDGGQSWTPFGQRLADVPIRALSIDGTGRRLRAGTSNGVYDLEIASGPMDVAAAPAGGSRVLAWNGERRSVGTLEASGAWTSGSSSPGSLTWTAVALAENGDGNTHVLWQCGDGRSALELIGTSGGPSVFVFPKRPGWIASDVSVRADGQTHVLWTGDDGRMRIARVSASGAVSEGLEIGPATGWSAMAISDAPGGDAWVLWRSTDGRSALSVHRDGRMASSYRYAAEPDWSVEDVAVGADGRPRLLRTTVGGVASVTTVDAAGRLVSSERHSVSGFVPRRIAAGADGRTRLLFGSDDGVGGLLVLGADNALASRHALHPLAGVLVTTTAELEAALAPANAGKHILVRAGEYEIGRSLIVPDRATLVGEGDMGFDESGRPAGFAASRRSVLRATADLSGDILTLGDGSRLRGLVIEDAAGRAAGNPVGVYSRQPGDFVSASVSLCEIVNPNPAGITPQGPTGRSLVVLSRNPNLGQEPPPHAGAALSVFLSDSIIRSPGAGYGVFAINFASNTRIGLVLERNVIGGGLNATGGVSRPDAVTGSSTSIRSRRNLYRSDSAEPTANGFGLIGGTTAPIPNLTSAASTSNSLRMRSRDDRVEGFARAISAVGGMRTSATSEPSSANLVDLDLDGAHVQSVVSDLVLFGAQTVVDGVSPGDGNTVRLRLYASIGSRTRDNQYANSRSASPNDAGSANRLEIVTKVDEFEWGGFIPRPSNEFFTNPW